MAKNNRYIPEIYEIDNIRQEIAEFPPYYKRNFTDRYCVQFNKTGFYIDTRISLYSNKICLLFLAKGHSIIQNHKSITKIDFQVGKENRLTNIVSGKHKKDAQRLQKNSVICFIETTDGMKYPFCSGIKGKLVDVNRTIGKDSSKIVEGFDTIGYIAMVFPDNFRDPPEDILNGFLTRQQYEDELSKREQEQSPIQL
ncbi:hypothetical protein HHI36_007722 [Cryptolaemus montrouzieri]|uniref:Protein Abitram n=1 Tax=Cryptolaemus montrouzieri TaxID=559131 RepID=A0ABD2MR82_9CUCU